KWVAVEDLLDTGEYATVYNLRVADWHTYFVGVREWQFSVWSHNNNGCVGDGLTAKQRAKADAKRQMAQEDALLPTEDVPFYKASGNYQLEFGSGMKYHGKGLEGRMNQSARELAAKHGDIVTNRTFTPADNETSAFAEEARRIAADG